MGRRQVSAALFVSFLVGAGCGTSDAETAGITARQLLQELQVSQPDTRNAYSRDKFGDDYVDADSDCENTRAEVLQRDSKQRTTGSCKIFSGLWQSDFEPFSTSLASEITIDHLVPLKEAWTSGASEWSTERRSQFFNDLGFIYSLSLMSQKLNSEKSSSDPSSWLPTQEVCSYAVRWVAVKYRWNLSIDKAEKDSLDEVMSGACGGERVSVVVAD